MYVALTTKSINEIFVNRIFFPVFCFCSFSRKREREREKKVPFEGSLPSVGKASRKWEYLQKPLGCFFPSTGTKQQPNNCAKGSSQVEQPLASPWSSLSPLTRSSVCVFPLLMQAPSVKSTPDLHIYVTDLHSALAPLSTPGQGRAAWWLLLA